MVKMFEWLAQKFKDFNNWFKKNWNNIIEKLLFKI